MHPAGIPPYPVARREESYQNSNRIMYHLSKDWRTYRMLLHKMCTLVGMY